MSLEPREQSNLGPYCLKYRLHNNISKHVEQTSRVNTKALSACDQSQYISLASICDES